MNKQKKLCVIVTSPISIKLFRGQLKDWIDKGWEVTCICGGYNNQVEFASSLGVEVFIIPMSREPNPIKDIMSFIRLWWFLLWHRFNILHISTPKASFLGSLSARLSGHNKIYYLLRGRAYENMTGIKRKIMCICEWFTCHLSSFVVPICREMGQVVVSEGLCPENKIRYVGNGSSCGIDLELYTRNTEVSVEGGNIRTSFGIPKEDILILFVGRIREDKGINELVVAFEDVFEKHNNIHLVLLGSHEQASPISKEIMDSITTNNNIHHLDWIENPIPVYAASDIVVLPSHREGFGNVAIEASAMGLPVIASDILGCREAVSNEVTGILFEKGNSDELQSVLEKLVNNKTLRESLGNNGREIVIEKFDQKIIWEETNILLDKLCQ